jgi:deazaflavin-dependent oxidoreductase (nitroreductase family)
MTLSDFTRWLYPGQRPNWIARILNRATAAVAASGLTANYILTLEVTGRRSGRIVSLPVVLALVDGQRYLVSMLGENVHWVHNVRAAGGRAALRSGGREEIQLEEVPTDQRAPILRAYLQRAPGARPHVPVNKDAALAEFHKVAAAFPVFRVGSHEALQRTGSASR